MKVALLADIHANDIALDAAYRDLDRIGVDRILVAGDLIGYYYAPAAVVRRLRDDPRVTCIRGNHEDMLRDVLTDDDAATAYHARYGSGLAACIEQLDTESLDWLAALPVSHETEIAGVSFHMSHGGLGLTDIYLYPTAPPDVLAAHYSRCDYTVFGHTHYPFQHQRGEQALINPGSVGQARDRSRGASYAIVDLANRAVQPRRIAFDAEPIIRAARERDPHRPYLHEVLER